MKYYDCLLDELKGGSHGTYLVDTIKMCDSASAVAIGPEICIDGEQPTLVAVGVDMTNKRVYVDGAWLDYKSFLSENEGFNIDTHVEITEEEFYHIPEDTEISLLPEDGDEVRKALFDKLLILAERYEEVLALGGSIPLVFWYKSLSVIVVSGNAHPAPMPITEIIGLERNGEDIALVTNAITFVTEGGKLNLYYFESGDPID